ncbi:MAG TPA: SRPBCC family protein [Rhodocyclaceae bacterium]|nr:SRPBCC family protein [Rhodocyclaceae bacterium]
MSDQLKELSNDHSLGITRLLDAPRELVWRVWTSPEHVLRWWGPAGFTNTNKEMDVRTGGLWRFTMHGPDGRDYQNRIDFVEVVKPERLVYLHSGEDDTSDIKFHVTVTFEEQAGKTQLSMRMVFDTAAELKRVVEEFGAEEGMHQHVARLVAYLESLA